MQEERNKENEIHLITQLDSNNLSLYSSKKPLRPLQLNNTISGVKSPKLPSTKMPTLHTPRSRQHSGAFLQTDNSLLGESKAFERQFADSLLKHNDLRLENQRLDNELYERRSQIEVQHKRILYYEQCLKDKEYESLKNQDLLQKQISMYKETIDDLQRKIITLSDELAINRTKLEQSRNEIQQSIDTNDKQDITQKYEKLMHEYKVLESNFELEINAKLVLMDQIEYLSHENEDLIKRIGLLSLDDLSFQRTNSNEFMSELHHETNHTMNNLSDESQELIDPNFVCFDHSSPIKNEANVSLESLHVADSFQFPPSDSSLGIIDQYTTPDQPHSHRFPPSPDPKLKNEKRSSLPLQQMLYICEGEEFVLSPFKLTTPLSENGGKEPRGKHTHTRYNSHDILPIMVEFEPPTKRSTSMPDKRHSPLTMFNNVIKDSSDDGKEDHRNDALLALNGFGGELNPNSVSSSKHSSYIDDDKTRQEITKLKFELQSLKLHNEKLLSYIGFELQKQKKNIKRLSKKQSQQSLLLAVQQQHQKHQTFPRTMEYSDAKLIESSRDELIKKKRVLRSVSINAILTKDYNRLGSDPDATPRDSISDFSKLGLHAQRSVYSSPGYLNIGSDYDDIDDIDDEDAYDADCGLGIYKSEIHVPKNLKKFASEVFSKRGLYSLSEDEQDDDDEDDEEEEAKEASWPEEFSTTENYSSSSEEEIGMLKQIQYLVMGNTNKKSKGKHKRKEDQHLVDDGLKFKFLTIALGIIIIGLKLTPGNHDGYPSIT